MIICGDHDDEDDYETESERNDTDIESKIVLL